MTEFSVLMSIYYKEVPSNFRESLDSIIAQSYKPSEIILVEDGPLTKDLYAVIEEYKKELYNLITVPLEKNSGLGIALNKGLKHCHYNIIARMDTDDISMPNRFEEEIKYLDTHPDIDVVSAWVEEFHDKRFLNDTIKKLPETQDEIYSYGKKRNPVNHPVVMFRKEAVLKAGGYKPFPLFEDYYLWVRILMNGGRFYNIQHPLLYFRRTIDMIRRRGGQSYAKKEIAFQREIYKIGYINLFQMLSNIFIRTCIRIMPLNFRGLVYRKLLRF